MADKEGDRRLTPYNNPDDNNITQPRQPQNIKGLLRYAIEAGSNVDNAEQPSQLDPDKREFLEKAIENITVNIIEEITKCINVLKGISTYQHDDDISNYEDAMDELSEYLDNIDVANDFYKLGGFDVCFGWLLRGPACMRWRAADLIAQCSQNNLFFQTKAIESNRLKSLVEAAFSDPDEKARLKAFYAVSCIVRENPNGLIQFLSLSGHKLILQSLKSTNDKLRTKAAFLLSSIAGQEPMFKDQFYKDGLLQEVINLLLQSSTSESQEHLLSALYAMIDQHGTSITYCKESQELVPFLKRLASLHSADDAFREEVYYIEQILKIISEGK